MGLANRLFSSRDELLQGAQDLAQQLAAFPQLCLRADRRSTRAQHGLPQKLALAQEFAGGMGVIESGESVRVWWWFSVWIVGPRRVERHLLA